MSQLRRDALASFLRTHRAKVSPQDVGLPPGVRRRTPGLRREEVALLAGVGVTWYTWLEQSRDIHPSPEVLGSIARTLGLTDAERDYLFRLAALQPPERPGVSEAPDHLVQLMYAQDPTPSIVLDDRWDLRAWNLGAETLYRFSDWPVADRNMAYLMFAAPEIRDQIADWPEHARRVVGELQESFARNPEDTRMAEIQRRLRAGYPQAREWLDERSVNARTGGFAKEIRHPSAGTLRLNQIVLRPADAPGLFLIVQQPADTDTAQRLAALVAGGRTTPV
ncbi:helix-turn-helix transcriptional regulator [Actinomadura fulvescens]|uniref:Helix-turn-helix transcriptional regulator n=1 Tax=Actinomadura fulvescens TaxID=46160 RepID=A0ABN3QBT5_9ACTN